MSRVMLYSGRKEYHGDVTLVPGQKYRADIFSDGKTFKVNVYSRIDNSFCSTVTVKEYKDNRSFYMDWSAAE